MLARPLKYDKSEKKVWKCEKKTQIYMTWNVSKGQGYTKDLIWQKAKCDKEGNYRMCPKMKHEQNKCYKIWNVRC